MAAIFKITALKQMMIGRAKYHFDLWQADLGEDDESFTTLLDKVRDHAKRKKLDGAVSRTSAGGHDAMDVGEVAENWGDPFGERLWGDLDAFGKGKSKGKGKGFQGSCYQCGEYGHPAR